ncbi:MAG: RDD family protein [Oscillochloris sp.]|nr:RDD family protein [Oscillochloris sp.]
MDNRYLVETPEIVDLAYDVAGIGSRCLAALIDTLLIMTVMGAVGLLLFFSVGQIVPDAAQSLVLAAWALLSFVCLWGYYLIFEIAWRGQTPGKYLFGLRVVREGGRPITAGAAAVRNLVRAVDFIPFGYGLGVLVMFTDARARRLGDLAAGTLVVREATALSLDRLGDQVAPPRIPPRDPAAPPPPLRPNLERISPDEDDRAQDFLRRRGDLAPAARARLADQLATVLRARLELPANGLPEPFIEHVVREYRVYLDIYG